MNAQPNTATAIKRMRGIRTTRAAEQLRANGMSDLAVARKLGLPVNTVQTWFDVQDEFALNNLGSAA
jgi:transposase